jgi:protein-S-isoprenylcysteine O-methyltransferase Ste14
MHSILSPAFAVFVLGFLCFAAFSWGVKGHFRRTGPIPAGTMLISLLTVGGFAWFAVRVATQAPGAAWPAACMLFAVAIALFYWTVRATKQTPPTLAFDTDQPSFLLRHGPYRYVRHPFYLSYLLFWIGTAVASSGLAPWLAPAVMLAVYRTAAGREEQKFAGSDFRMAYEAYRRQAGMFLPRVPVLAS